MIQDQIRAILSDCDTFTDLLFASGSLPMKRSPRGWQAAGCDLLPSTHESISTFIEELEPNWQALITKGEINRPYHIDGWRLRINAYLAFAGSKVMLCVRRIREHVPDFKELRLPSTLPVLLNHSSGLILVSGATGSGKTTSVAAMVEYINGARPAHIVSIEDPIEYIWKPRKCVFSQREVGVDCDTFTDGVAAALRQKPDVVVIGEIRDRATAEQALQAGESGHLVLATMHASSAVGTVSKLLSFFPDNERIARVSSLASCLLGIINQTLIPNKDGLRSVLAIEAIANAKRDYSRLLLDPEKMQSRMESHEDALSIGLATSVLKLIDEGAVERPDAVKATMANAAAFERISEKLASAQGEGRFAGGARR